MSDQLKQKFDEALRQIFEEGQARLPPIDRIWQPDQQMCGAVDDGYTCSKCSQHEGDHVSHGMDGGANHRWPR